MNTRDRGILTGLAVVLAAGIVFILVFANRAQDGGGEKKPPVSPEGWDLRHLPDLGTPVREFKTPGGVLVQVIEEGRGKPVGKGQAMDIDYTAFITSRRSPVGRGIFQNLVLRKRKNFPGLIEGLGDMKPFEKRRLLIPAELAYGGRAVGDVPPNTDLVFDVRWTRLITNDIKDGTGKVARPGSKVLVHYRGMLEDGTVFDSSFKKGKPFEARLRRPGLIDGWVLGIPGMKEGGTRKLWIPWHLGYGETGNPPDIGPYANLEFLVELRQVD